MVRTNGTKRAELSEPLSHFEAPKRPEISRLPPFDDTETGPQTSVNALGKVPERKADPLLLT